MWELFLLCCGKTLSRCAKCASYNPSAPKDICAQSVYPFAVLVDVIFLYLSLFLNKVIIQKWLLYDQQRVFNALYAIYIPKRINYDQQYVTHSCCTFNDA